MVSKKLLSAEVADLVILSNVGTGITIRETGTPGIAARFEMTVPEGT